MSSDRFQEETGAADVEEGKMEGSFVIEDLMEDENEQPQVSSNNAGASDPTQEGDSIAKEQANVVANVLGGAPKTGESGVERMANSFESRREKRIPVTPDVRIWFLNGCKRIALAKDYGCKAKIRVSDLPRLRAELLESFDQRRNCPMGLRRLSHRIGFRDRRETLNRVLDRAEEVAANDFADDVAISANSGLQLKSSAGVQWFHYRDFTFYHTVNENSLPWMRYSLSMALIRTVAFYLATPIFFCYISRDYNVCPDTRGWLASVYFASVTMSTVGYGDITVQKDNSWHVFVGAAYMIVALLITMLSFSAVIDASKRRGHQLWEKILLKVAEKLGFKPNEKNISLEKTIKLIRYFKIGDILIEFAIVLLIGVFASRVVLLGNPALNWTWMESFYWAVQTSTTVGYGDLDMGPNMMGFNIFYVILGTYFAGGALSKLAELNAELQKKRREYAWDRLQSNSGTLMGMDENKDGKVDQYEFVLASLFMLGKIDSSDITPIMEKFKSLAGEKNFIEKDIITQKMEEDLDEDDELDADGNTETPFWKDVDDFREKIMTRMVSSRKGLS